MDKLPIEILENIACDGALSIRDVVNLSSTCHYLRDILLSSNVVWKQKFCQRWPSLTKRMPAQVQFFDETRHLMELRNKTRLMLETMSPRFYKKSQLSESDLQEWEALVDEHFMNYYYLVYDLMQIVNCKDNIHTMEVIPLNTPGNKTMQYYSRKVLRFIRQVHLSQVWKEYMSQPSHLQTLEIGATIVAQWCQPTIEISCDSISDALDALAEQVKKRLKEVYPFHSLLQLPPSVMSRWKHEKLNHNQFSAVENRQLMTTLREEMFVNLGFKGNNQTYYMPRNSFINAVLETREGLPITLSVIFEAVARRLGLKCDPINVPAHFLLRFAESKDSDWYYVDVFNGRNVVKRGMCPHSKGSAWYATATAAEVVERMANNLEVSSRQHSHPNGRITRVRSALELLKLVNPQDLSAIVSLARLYMLHNMDTKPLENFLLSQNFQVPEQAQRVVAMLRDYQAHHARHDDDLYAKIEAARRTDNLKYAVGMVMSHLTLNYKCVIYDWDPICLADRDWQIQNNVDALSMKTEQPFYNVLAEDGSHRYVAQENLRPSNQVGYLYLNEEVGRHFSHFFEVLYVPNAEKEKEYPDDKHVRHMYYKQITSGSHN